MSERVKGYWSTRKGKRKWISSYTRKPRGDKFQNVPVTVTNPTLKVSSAQYDPLTKSTNIAIIDEDKDKITFVMQEIPFKVKSMTVDENSDIGLILDSKHGKDRQMVTAIIETPKNK